MDADSRIGQEIPGEDHRGRVHTPWSMSRDWGQVRRWQSSRVVVAAVAAAGAAALVVATNGMMTETAATWWSFVVLAAGSVLTGLVAGSYIGAPIGAEATLCDLRWPVLGLTGLVVATSTGQGSLAAHLFAGAAPAVLAGMIQPAFAVLSVALLRWALRERLELERKAVSPSPDGDSGDVCTTCRPLFPTRPGSAGGPSA